MNHFLILLVLFSSCTRLIKMRDQDLNPFHIKEKSVPRLCEEKNPESSYISSSSELNEDFHGFIELLKKQKIKLQFIDEVVLWSLLQMNYRPDLASPSSRLQLLLRIEGTSQYWDFLSNPKDDHSSKSWPYLYGLDHLLKTYKGKHNLLSLGGFIDRYYTNPIIVGEGLSSFISEHKGQLLNYELTSDAFFKGKEGLKNGETLKKIHYSNLLKRYHQKGAQKAAYLSFNKLFYYSPTMEGSAQVIDNGPMIQCNFDLGLYQSSIYLISPTKNKYAHVFGMANNKGESFMAASGQVFENMVPIEQSFLIQGLSFKSSSPLCLIQNQESSIFLSSTQDRDPGQHLYNLIQYNIAQTSSMRELEEFIKFPRHLFLTNPVRMIYESKRGTKQQLEAFLGMDFPIYHSKSLGKVWGWGHFQSPKKKMESGFVLDDRHEGSLSCH